MRRLTTSQLREEYLDFFVAKAHRLVKSDSLVPANDPSVLFTSAGMNQFKDHFLGKVKDFRRATSCQKCLRTGDLEEVGRTPFHHTFFEMLGNFSFGDYFKKEAIAWAWEFVTQVLEIETASLWVSVYEDDSEALEIWRKEIGLPAEKIRKFGAQENFWPANAIQDGPNGPCGPCSEIYVTKENGESVEVWNLVFTQFNRSDNGVLEPLPSKNIDTGMGLERAASVLQGVASNFQIDIFAPIVDAVRRELEGADTRLLHTIADHGRAVAFCIADGVLPSNDGRGYVVRKLIRRSLHLAQAEPPKPFLYKIVSSVSAMMSDQYPEILERRDNIAQIVKAEEEKYIRNILEGGSERLEGVIEQLKAAGKKELPAEVGLDLYVTYGIQPDFTRERCEKQGIGVDLKAIDALIAQEQHKSRVGSKMATNIFSKEEFALAASRFVGYETDHCQAKVLQIIKEAKEIKAADRADTDYWVVLDPTPFYAEAGGQVGDRGQIRWGSSWMKVEDVRKQKDAIVHLVRELHGEPLKVGMAVEAAVDGPHRSAVKRAHTATHVLQAVLRQVLGPHVQQAGSFVEPDRFRFDFTHFQEISSQEMERIAELLNDYVLRNDSLSAQVMPKAEAQKTGAIALFGEKYEDTVRVVSIGDYSKEFCGGTHAEATGQIGMIVISSASSVGSGLRRVEAVTGKEAFRQVQAQLELLNGVCAGFKTTALRLPQTVAETLERLKMLERESGQLKERVLKDELDVIAKEARKIGAVSFLAHIFENYDAVLLRRAIDLLKTKITASGVFLLVSVQEARVHFVCGLTQDLVDRGLSADALLKAVLVPLGGSGGGRKDFAQGGIKDVSQVKSGFRAFEGALLEALKKGGPA